MPFVPPASLDNERLQTAVELLCDTFGVPSLRPHQRQTGENILLGYDTILDAPTGAGKTLAFYLPLFYYWSPGSTISSSQKVILVISPLVELMKSQASELNERGIPAAAMTADATDLDEILTCYGNNQYRVGFVSPELAGKAKFQTKVLDNKLFRDNLLCFVIDEAHCISEWGGDDFRKDYSTVPGMLRGCLPGRTPILVASATMPRDVIADIQHKVGLTTLCRRVEISNEKLNIALSVRVMQHSEDSFADLLTLVSPTAEASTDIPQTLVYVNSRTDAEEIQDFFRLNCPQFPPEAFEYYHRHIAPEQKTDIQKRLRDGRLRIIPTTDALGMGVHYPHVKRVVLWNAPKTMCSLAQKIGRCRGELGEGITYITKTYLTKNYVDESESEVEDSNMGEEDATISESDALPDDEATVGVIDEQRDAMVDDDTESISDPELTAAVGPKKRRLGFKKMSPMQARDHQYLIEYLVTARCRRIPWNTFFDNDTKNKVDPPLPEGTRCCDNCHPRLFPVDTITVTGENRLKTGRMVKSPEALEDAVVASLNILREKFLKRDRPRQHFLASVVFLDDDIIQTLAERAPLLETVESFSDYVHWHWSYKYAEEVLQDIKTVVSRFPPVIVASARAQLEEQRVANALSRDVQRSIMVVFKECHVLVEKETYIDSEGKIHKHCESFERLPRRNLWPEYYTLIKTPIAISGIRKKASMARVGYHTLHDFYLDWELMFANARAFNELESQIVQSANHLQRTVAEYLYNRGQETELPGYDLLPEPGAVLFIEDQDMIIEE